MTEPVITPPQRHYSPTVLLTHESCLLSIAALADHALPAGEDIADKGGLHTAYKAMVTYLQNHQHLSGSDLARAKRRFFEAWAQT